MNFRTSQHDPQFWSCPTETSFTRIRKINPSLLPNFQLYEAHFVDSRQCFLMTSEHKWGKNIQIHQLLRLKTDTEEKGDLECFF